MLLMGYFLGSLYRPEFGAARRRKVLLTAGFGLIGLFLLLRWLNGYGNVPYFYFIVHLTLLRILNLVLIMVSGVGFHSDGNPIVWQAKGFGYPLWMCYLYWAFVVLALCLPCKWYGHYKRAHRQWWLSYL